jgi:flagellar protein FlaJ
MEIKKIHWIGIIISLAVIISSFFLIGNRFFFFTIGLGVLIGAFPFVLTIIQENRIAAEKEEMFLEFSRNLVESVKTGTPIGKSIINVRNKPYGVLSENVRKLANQIAMGIPLNSALQIFSKDVKNKPISRALTLIGQAERGGGEIGGILESVTEAVSTADKLKKERKAAISTLVVQGYIIFFVFIVIIMVMQFQILPLITNIVPAGETLAVGGLGGATPIGAEEVANSFLYLLLIQGLFSGLTIGKLAEGKIKTGIKHSFALILTAFLISSGATLILGG